MSQQDESVRLQYAPVEVRKSSSRQAPRTDFAITLQRGIAKTNGALRRTIDSAGYVIPGAAVVGAAINELGATADTDAAVAHVGADTSPGLGSSGTLADMRGSIEERARSGDTAAQNMAFMQQMQEMNQVFNVQYLQIQSEIQNESRRYSVASNIMKAKHDTARNSVQNLK